MLARTKAEKAEHAYNKPILVGKNGSEEVTYRDQSERH